MSKVTTAKEVLEAGTHSSVEQPVGSLADVGMGDMVKFKTDDSDKQLRGLPGHVRGIRNGKLDVYVGSSLRAEIDPTRVVKLVKA